MPLSVASIAPVAAAPGPTGRGVTPASAGGTAAAQAAPADQVTLSRTVRDAVAGAGRELTAEQLRVVAELVARDRQVRAHEAAHMAAGGALTGGAHYAYQTGPDGKQYAVGGEVSVDLRGGATPDETIANARQVRAAALAPADPSAQDLAVAAAAMSLELEALAAKARQALAAYRAAGGAPGQVGRDQAGRDAQGGGVPGDGSAGSTAALAA